MLVLVAAFIANHFLKVNILLIILACGLIGAADTLYRQRKEGERK